MNLTTLSIVVIIGILFLVVFTTFFVIFMKWLKNEVIIVVRYRLSPIWTRCYHKVITPVQDRLTRIAERRARERAPQARDVTTELATAPGEFYM